MTETLPPGVTLSQFQLALNGFREAVGTDWVFIDDDDVASYLDPFAIGDQLEHAASAAVAPNDTAELQKVLAVANQYKIPVWPISMGKNFAYGTSAPRMKGTVILDLKRMNQVLEINETLGYALVEPGVSFFDFKAELDKRGSKFWMSGPSHSWGSVIGNALEHGVGYTRYGEHADFICGMEVMLADGSLVRTGFGATEGSKEWQCYKWPFGPSWDGIFTQSNFGIVTKMGIWLMPEPYGMAGVSIDVKERDGLPKLVDTLRPLRLDDTINAPFTISNGWRKMSGGRTRATAYDGPGAVPAERVAELLAKDKEGWWGVTFNLFDRPEILDIKLRAIEEAFRDSLPTAEIKINRWQRGEPQKPWMRQELALGPLGVVNWHGGPGGHTDLGPVIAAEGERAQEVYDLIEKRFIEFGVDPWVGMFGMGGRALVMVADLFYLRYDEEMTARCRALFQQLCKELAAMGIGLYRSHLTFMDDGAAMQNWNDHAFGKLNQKLKGLLDPNGIIAPGKQGIWPEKRG